MTETIEIQELPLWDKLKTKKTPVSFDIEITARCNMNCTHCYINLPASDRKAKASELSVKEILHIASEAVEMGALWCLITGGEPLLRKDFPEIYMGLKRLGLLVEIFTNATLINEEHIALFKKYPPRDIEITVYGVTQKTYEAVTRCPGSFIKFMRRINALIESGINVRLKAMSVQANLHEQQAIADFCRARTKDYYRFDPLLHLRFDGNKKRNKEIISQRLTPEQIVALDNNDEQRLSAMRKECKVLMNEEFIHGGGNHLFHCGAGKNSFTVSYDGRFRLCSSLWADGATYDLRDGTLKEAFQKFVPRVLDLRSERKDFLESCRKCELVNLCYWCPAHAHLETGMLDGKTPYFCEVAHQRVKNLKMKMKQFRLTRINKRV